MEALCDQARDLQIDQESPQALAALRGTVDARVVDMEDPQHATYVKQGVHVCSNMHCVDPCMTSTCCVARITCLGTHLGCCACLLMHGNSPWMQTACTECARLTEQGVHTLQNFEHNPVMATTPCTHSQLHPLLLQSAPPLYAHIAGWPSCLAVHGTCCAEVCLDCVCSASTVDLQDCDNHTSKLAGGMLVVC